MSRFVTSWNVHANTRLPIAARRQNRMRRVHGGSAAEILEMRVLLSAVVTVDDGDSGYSETGPGWAQGSLAGGYANDYRVIDKPGSGTSTDDRIIDNCANGYVDSGSPWLNGGVAGGFAS